MNLGWMAWTWPTGAFFLFILFVLLCMSVWAVSYTHLTLPTILLV